MKRPLHSKETRSGADTQADNDDQMLVDHLQKAKLQDEPQQDELQLGDGAWMSLDELREYYDQAVDFEALVDWGELINACSKIRDGMPCELGDTFAAGSSNLMRQVIFQDGVLWVARLRYGGRRMVFHSQDTIVETEVAALRFLKSQTSIPVPEVYGYNAVEENPVRARYILLEFIHGYSENYMNKCQRCSPSSEDYEQCTHDRYLMEQLAVIQTELATIQFDSIGCIQETSSDPGRFAIGPDVTINKGPWKSSLEFFRDTQDVGECALGFMEHSELEQIEEDGSRALPTVFFDLVTKYRERSLEHGPFGLALRGFGAHKVLLNEDFEIVALTDVSGLMAAPIEVQAQFPSFTRLDYEPLSIARVKNFLKYNCRPLGNRLEEYVRMVKKCEKAIGNDLGLEVRPGDWMIERSTVAYLALMWSETQDPYIIQKWMGYCLRQYYDW